MKYFCLFALFLILAVATSEAAINCAAVTCSKLVCNGEQNRDACLAKGATGAYKFVERGGTCGCCHNCIQVLSKFF